MSKLEINYFGNTISEKELLLKTQELKSIIDNLKFYLIIAGTNTSQIEGISAAGLNAKARRRTALADAEFVLFGPFKNYEYKLPQLKAGVTPALISYVCSRLIKAKFIIVPIGIDQKPYFEHLQIEMPSSFPAACISSGRTMSPSRVLNLYKKGFLTGSSLNKPLFISESVPGGTTTAQAVMEAFGLNVSNLIGSSLINPPRELKKSVIDKGLSNANLNANFNSLDVIAAVGDPFQAFALGLLIGARQSGEAVVLSGGSQMIALLLLALENLQTLNKQNFVDKIFIVTTNWLVRDDSLNNLLNLVSNRHGINIFGLASGLNFKKSKAYELLDYEEGYVKEGVGAGGLSILAYLKGFNYETISLNCELYLKKMKQFGQISTISDN